MRADICCLRWLGYPLLAAGRILAAVTALAVIPVLSAVVAGRRHDVRGRLRGVCGPMSGPTPPVHATPLHLDHHCDRRLHVQDPAGQLDWVGQPDLRALRARGEDGQPVAHLGGGRVVVGLHSLLGGAHAHRSEHGRRGGHRLHEPAHQSGRPALLCQRDLLRRLPGSPQQADGHVLWFRLQLTVSPDGGGPRSVSSRRRDSATPDRCMERYEQD
mmetsp:Transcript_106318/g.317745  ORF Transcript_106318/g.317745 Transcript_106318/m.317745 type:complete len:215 (+) Transcript_106318:20-664(+)